MINIKLRFKNFHFCLSLLLFLISTVASVAHITNNDVSTWKGLYNVLLSILGNPSQIFSIILAVYGYVIDPTSKGFSDSKEVLGYSKLK